MQKEKHGQSLSEDKKKRNKKILIGGAVVVVLGAVGTGIYYLAPDLFKKKAGDPLEELNLLPGKTPSGSTKSEKYTDQSFPLKLNSEGTKVEIIQKALNLAVDAGLNTDGKWGTKTQEAMKKAKQKFPSYIKSLEVDEKLYNTLKDFAKTKGLGSVSHVYALNPGTAWTENMQIMRYSTNQRLGQLVETMEDFTTFSANGEIFKTKAENILTK